MNFRRLTLDLVTPGLCLVVAAGVASSCGSKAPTVAGAGGTSTSTAQSANREDAGGTTGGQGGGAACVSKASCPEAAMDVASPGFTATGLRGFVSEAVPWEFQGLDLNSRDRKVGVLLNNVPAGSKLTPSDRVDTTAKIEWTPAQKMKSTKKLEIFMRDIDRCEVLEEDPDVCREYRYLKAYDKKTEIDWEVVARGDGDQGGGEAGGGGDDDDGDTVTVAKPDCGPPPTTDGDLTQKALGGILDTFTKGAGGGGGLGDLGGLLSTITGGGGGGGGGGAAANPKEC